MTRVDFIQLAVAMKEIKRSVQPVVYKLIKKIIVDKFCIPRNSNFTASKFNATCGDNNDDD